MNETAKVDASEWLQVMLGEIDRKKAEAREAEEESARRDEETGEKS